ncbi:hypothetical protein HPT27_09960 [Permianibacter sp. IMCC34836]|uniref:MucB/RseB C-terminal domain-containing protein n=1 Tax=Permianibacter fluminis TaxID=2738515 RepID=UPI00155765E7|nr:MucB/RseB C-terminal domain-containing protein [Permianibacter fluminis]NQD37353.1 hypothetical protein [Permianibacter fluminis]
MKRLLSLRQFLQALIHTRLTKLRLSWLGTALCLPLSAGAVEPDPNALLDGMVRAFRELNYDLSFVYVRDGKIEPMRLVHALSEGRERERLVHLNGQPREVIREDDTITAYLAGAQPVMLDKADGNVVWTRALLSNLQQMRAHYQLSDGGPARIAGRDAREIIIRSSDGERYGYRLWVDASSGLLLRSDLLNQAEQIIEQWQVVSLQVKDAIPEADLRVGFAVSAPAGVRVLTAKAPATEQVAAAWQVGWLPDGFTLRSQQMQHRNDSTVPVQHLLFSDGVASISVYVSLPPQGVNSLERTWRKGAMTIVETADRERRVTVVGDIPSQTARRIAGSVKALPVKPEAKAETKAAAKSSDSL